MPEYGAWRSGLTSVTPRAANFASTSAVTMPDPAELGKRVTPHARGAILVAAVFDAFLAIYRVRTADLLRIG